MTPPAKRDGGPDVVGLTEAAKILGIRPAAVRDHLQDKGAFKDELAAGAIWHREAVQRIAEGKTSSRRPPKSLGLTEAAQLLGTQKSNVRKWMARRGLVARELTMGPVWYFAAVEREKRRWDRTRPRSAAA